MGKKKKRAFGGERPFFCRFREIFARKNGTRRFDRRKIEKNGLGTAARRSDGSRRGGRMERKEKMIAILAVLTAALGVGCDDAELEKVATDADRAAQAVEERANADWTATKETFDEQKAALWEASAPVREKAQELGEAASAKVDEWSEAASAKASEWKESASAKVDEWSETASAKAEEWGEAASTKAVEWSEKAADAVEDWAARRENATNGEETETAETPRENE
jgi:hypothetical protein